MNNTDFISSDDSDTEYFPEDLLDNIPENSDYDSDEKDSPKNNSTNTDLGSSPLELKVDLTPTWKYAFNYIKQWSAQQDFFIRKERSEKILNEHKRQTLLCHCQEIHTNKTKKNQTKPSKSQ
ncbi:hypothetical protein C1645_731974 [Glomus cerebriforme]|uniref:Uncharacterized protein n=1 Tax=Glomus cerebriforme TaxID=658196 RepID=A0A397TIM3_9GLOM|nr:hypothetical protein C1645_731974 [Glomus cerebriforme]